MTTDNDDTAALRKNPSRTLMDRMAQSAEADEEAANAMWEQPKDEEGKRVRHSTTDGAA